MGWGWVASCFKTQRTKVHLYKHTRAGSDSAHLGNDSDQSRRPAEILPKCASRCAESSSSDCHVLPEDSPSRHHSLQYLKFQVPSLHCSPVFGKNDRQATEDGWGYAWRCWVGALGSNGGICEGKKKILLALDWGVAVCEEHIFS